MYVIYKILTHLASSLSTKVVLKPFPRYIWISLFIYLYLLFAVVSGGLELRLDSPQPQAEAEVRRRGPGQLYDADDEEGDVVTSEVVLSRVSG